MKKILLPIAFILIFNLATVAGEATVITLKDGSTIKGDVVGMENGQYIITTPTMGNIKVNHENVASIVANENTAPANPGINVTSTPEFKNIQAKIVSNPDVMNDIQKLADDPEIMKLMSDPSFIAAIQSGNAATLQSDPRLKRLSENPKMQSLIQKIHPQP